MRSRDARIDQYIAQAQPFAGPILTYIRDAVHEGCPECEEALKWGHPSFMYRGILCGMAAFKQHVTFGFWKASALNQDDRRSGEAMGQFGRITSIKDLPRRSALVALVKKAVELHDAGKAPRTKTTPKAPLKEPPYFRAALEKNRKALDTYEGFSPSARREYVEWVVEAKREDTRRRRLDTAVAWMAEGKHRNWKYMSR